jgi:hypothetical protein
MGYLGTGAWSNVGGPPPTAVSAGNPPVAATGAGATSYMLTLAANVYLFAAPGTGKLYLYNATAGALHFHMHVDGSADLGKY